MLSLFPKNFSPTIGLPPIFNTDDYYSDTTIDAAFEFIKALQAQIGNILTTISNIYYDATNSITSILDYVYVMSMSTSGSIAVSQNASISGTLNAVSINNVVMQSQSIQTGTMTATSIQCNNLSFTNDVGVYMNLLVSIPTFNQQTTSSFLTIPLIKSELMSTLVQTVSAPFYLTLTLKPNYSVYVVDSSGTILATVSNSSSGLLYNQAFTLQKAPYEIRLYLNGIMLSR